MPAVLRLIPDALARAVETSAASPRQVRREAVQCGRRRAPRRRAGRRRRGRARARAGAPRRRARRPWTPHVRVDGAHRVAAARGSSTRTAPATGSSWKPSGAATTTSTPARAPGRPVTGRRCCRRRRRRGAALEPAARLAQRHEIGVERLARMVARGQHVEDGQLVLGASSRSTSSGPVRTPTALTLRADARGVPADSS